MVTLALHSLNVVNIFAILNFCLVLHGKSASVCFSGNVLPMSYCRYFSLYYSIHLYILYKTYECAVSY
jgi:hypothetical protein